MFWTKKTVNCEECGCVIEEHQPQKVTVEDRFALFYSSKTLYYCIEHKKPYDLLKQGVLGTLFFYKTNQTIRVNKDGTPFVEKKEEPKQSVAADTVFGYTFTGKPKKRKPHTKRKCPTCKETYKNLPNHIRLSH